MKLSVEGKFRLAARLALAAGMGAMMHGAHAQETTAEPKGEASDSVELDSMQVTGTLLKRSDLETASPVTVIDRAAIETSGVATLGQLLQRMPSVLGAATSPQVNNSGGTGAATISLRGLGSARTLILVNGRRIVTADVNSIPANMIERVEVLKDGASTTYGSDAIGGVVNFITRNSFEGGELSAQYGISDENDADLQSYFFTFGAASEKGHVVAGLDFNDRRSVPAGDRNFSKEALYLYFGAIYTGGSPTQPRGTYRVPVSNAQANGLDTTGCQTFSSGSQIEVTRIEGRTGSGGWSDYRCRDGSPGSSDFFNFQPYNLDLTPQRRYSGFFLSDYAIAPNVNVFAEGFYSHTESKYQLAPEPLNTFSRGVVVSKDSYYNPFGVDVARAALRLTAVGPREEEFTTDRIQLSTGFKGNVFDRFNWETYFQYGNENQNSQARGELYVPAIAAAVGPSFLDPTTNLATCGTAAAPISRDSCVPFNIFGVPTADQLGLLVPTVKDKSTYELLTYNATIGGDIFNLPAGAVAAAVGYQHRWEQGNYVPDYLRAASLISGNASQALSGSFDVDEWYGELGVPILSNLPGIESLYATFGIRYSDYNTFGDTTNTKVGLEYRPYSDLLIRGTYAEVFRAPTISDLYSGQNESAISYDDPCNGLTTPVGENANIDRACQGVVRDGSYSQAASQILSGGVEGGNPDLKPETGESYTVGFAYSPDFYKPFSMTVDYWHFSLKDTISVVGANNILEQCFLYGNFCEKYNRDENGEIDSLVDVTENVGSLKTDGIDVGMFFKFPTTPFGRFDFDLNYTYLIKYTNERLAGDPNSSVSLAGKFEEAAAGGDGNYARNKAQASLGWTYNQWFLQWTVRYIGAVTENADLGFDPTEPCDGNVQASGALCSHELERTIYHDLYGSYDIAPINVQVSFGVDNVSNELPPIAYTGFAKNYDARTYDAIGRFYYARLKYSF